MFVCVYVGMLLCWYGDVWMCGCVGDIYSVCMYVRYVRYVYMYVSMYFMSNAWNAARNFCGGIPIKKSVRTSNSVHDKHTPFAHTHMFTLYIHTPLAHTHIYTYTYNVHTLDIHTPFAHTHICIYIYMFTLQSAFRHQHACLDTIC